MRKTKAVIFTKDISRNVVYSTHIQSKAGPRSSGTPFLVVYGIIMYSIITYIYNNKLAILTLIENKHLNS